MGVIPTATVDDRVAGAVFQGKVYLFLDQLADRMDVRRALFHELLHYGLRRFLTKDQYIAQMTRLYERDAAAIRLANMKVNAGTSIATSVSNLFYVNNAIIREFNKRLAASKAGAYTLTAFEQAILDGNNNAFRNPDETITWALTNREAQKWLESVPYKQSGNLWGALVQAVRSFLGLQAKADTALSEVLQLGQELLEANVNSLAQMAGAVGTNFSINAPAGQIILQNVSSATATVGDHEGGH